MVWPDKMPSLTRGQIWRGHRERAARRARRKPVTQAQQRAARPPSPSAALRQRPPELSVVRSPIEQRPKEARKQQAATAEILKVIASSPSDVQPVFEAIAASANRLIGGFSTAVFRVIDGVVHLVAFTPTNPEADEALKATFPHAR